MSALALPPTLTDMSTNFRDYYAALGVSKAATAAEIQRAYRALARKYHPDVNKSPEAVAKFSQAAEAYEVLKDADRRSRYDELGVDIKAGRNDGSAHHGGPNGDHRAGGSRRKGRATAASARGGAGRAGGPGGPGGMGGMGGMGQDSTNFGGPGVSDFFSSFFGSGGGGEGYGPSAGGRGGIQSPSELEISVPLAVAVLGGQHAVDLVYPNGSTRSLNIKVPKASVGGDVLRLAGQGQNGADLLLKLNIAPDPRFSIDGRDLVGKLVVSPAMAVIGGKATAELLDTSLITVTVPPRSKNGRRLRLRGKGVPGRTVGQSAGDLILEINLVVPEPISDEALAMYESLFKLETAAIP